MDTKQQKINIIKDWKDLFTQIGDNQSLLSSLKDSSYYKNFGKKSFDLKENVFIVYFRGSSTSMGTTFRYSWWMSSYS